jgi:hypothetical protein
MQVASGSRQGPAKRTKRMGKYLIAWLLGVPAVVLVLIYFIFD